MRHLESYDSEEQARGLSDALEIQGIENDLRSDPGGDSHSESSQFSVWVIDDARLAEAKQVVRDRLDSKASAGEQRAEAERIRKQRADAARPVRIAGVSSRGLAGAGPAGSATVGLILVCVAVGIFSGLGDRSSPIVRALTVVPISPEGYYYAQIDWSEPWRLLTPMLIHFGLLHLAFNMLWLYRLGSQIENIQGQLVLAGLVVLTQVPGTLSQLELSGPMFGGMSGVVYGLFGYSWMQARYGSRGYSLSDQDTLWIMGWFVLCATGLVGHIANAQHALGLVFGLLAGMPAYLAFRRSSANVQFAEGSWADLNIRGFPRFRRLYFEPYVPLWFMALAAGVLWLG